jgi:predicted glycoside hydrolase/deacetylase ChbG (UPF0249 family)
MTRKLIVNADDFGRTPGVNAGILRAATAGIVTSTTAMMNMPGAANALLEATQACPTLGMGVHLVFTSGRPLIPPEWVSSLVDKHGVFLSQEAIAAEPDRLDPGELKTELKAQIKTFQNAMGRAPDHLDVHHFAHLLPRYFAVYLELADEVKIPIRNPLPRTEEELTNYPPAGSTPFPREQLQAAVRADWDLLKKYTVRSPQQCLMGFFGAEALTLANVLHILDSLPDGTTELMTHPGLADEMLLKESEYVTQREKELELLCHPTVKEHIATLGIKLINFASL